MTSERLKVYRAWNTIKQRCYSTTSRDYHGYGAKGVIMSDDWLVFDNFYNWYKENYYEVDGEYMAIDKDILSGDNKMYSAETCLLVPFRINNMFVHKIDGEMRGLQKRGKKYEVKVRNPLTGKNDYCGTYESVEIASNVYKKCKEAIIQGVAEDYKGRVPQKVYDALISYRF